MYYYTTSYVKNQLFDNCNLLTQLLLRKPNDGVSMNERGEMDDIEERGRGRGRTRRRGRGRREKKEKEKENEKQKEGERGAEGRKRGKGGGRGRERGRGKEGKEKVGELQIMTQKR